MPTELLLAPVGAGKTDRVLAALVDTLKVDPFAKIWVLLPTRRQTDAFRQRLIDMDSGRRVYFNVEFFSFYTLYARLLDMAGLPGRELDATARLRLLRGILADLHDGGELEIFGAIADKRGFAEIVADFIYELKQNLVEPDDFGKAADTPKDRDLIRIYGIYQEQLRKYGLVDREGEGWLALAVATADNEIANDVKLLVVDGFDQFNPLQARLLALLAGRAGRALVTLATVRGRERTVGRRFEEARRQLEKAHDLLGVPLVAHPVAALRADTRPPALRYLVENSFLPVLSPRSSEGSLTWIEAPDPAQEAAAVLRRVKRLLLDGQGTPDDILIAVRDWPRYATHFAAMGRAYKIPLSLHYGEPLTENPAVIALLNLLDLHEYDFRRRDLLDTLRSPYFQVAGLGSQWVDLLEKVSQSQLVIGGRDEWLEAVKRAATRPPKDDDLERLVISDDEKTYLLVQLSAFFDAVTPPAKGTIEGYAVWLETLIGADTHDPDDEPTEDLHYGLQLFRQLRETTRDETIISRDLSAMKAFKDVLKNLLTAQHLFSALGLNNRMTEDWSTFAADLKAALKVSAINRDANRAGKVLVTTVADARGLPHRHVFIPGLSEGVFPAPAPEDPLYLDSERVALTARGIPLETSAERAADEGIFYEIISGACETLTLSRPTVQNGALWPESHLWRAVRDLFSDSRAVIEANRVRLGGVVPAGEVATLAEAALAAANGLNQVDPNDQESVLNLYNWLVTQRADAWVHIRLGRAIELGRIGRGNFDRYSGRLTDARLIEWAAGELSQKRVWSASQFNDYGMCGFRFFAKRLLKLEALEEPEDGMDAAQRGTINHSILEETYRRLGDLNIAPENADHVVTILHQVAHDVLRDAPTTIGFRASALWEQEKVTLVRKLEKLVRLDFSSDSPVAKHFGDEARQTYRLENPFSNDGRNVIEINLGTGLEPLRVTGYIDRIDRQGDQVILIDYKSGSRKIPIKEMSAGRNFQMMLYLLAADQILANDPDPNRPTQVAGGLFWHLQNRDSSGEFRHESADDQEALRSAADHLTEQISRGRAGKFGVQPSKAGHGTCAHYCEFNQLCRVNTIHRSKSHG